MLSWFSKPAACRKVLQGWLALMLVLVFATACAAQVRLPVQGGSAAGEYSGTVVEPPKKITQFNLISQTGATFGLRDLRGRPTLIYFGYTSCPDFCPMTLGIWKQVKAGLGAAAQDIGFVLISLDPERDTPSVLTQYLAKFDTSFTGLTGDQDAIQAVAKEFGVYFNNEEIDGEHAGGGEHTGKVDHATYSYLVDREGRLSKVYAYGVPAEVFVRDLRSALQ